MISRSVPHTPSARVLARIAPSVAGGSGTSSRLTELGIPGSTVSARIALPYRIRHRGARARSCPPSDYAGSGEKFHRGRGLAGKGQRRRPSRPFPRVFAFGASEETRSRVLALSV